MRWQHGGALDHGCCYAANGFRDPVTKQFVLFGWIFEEDLPQALADEQEWSGCLSIPRVLSLRMYQNVTALRTNIEEITCFETTASGLHSGFDVSVLTVMPDSRLHKLRREKLPMKFTKPPGQLECRLRCNVQDTSVSFDLRHSATEKTTITFNPMTETITVDRSISSSRPEIVKTSKSAPHTLFRYANGEVERLEFVIFFDTSVVEIFANDRTALTTRVYPEAGSCIAVEHFCDQTALSECEIWRLDRSTTWG